MTKSVRVFTDGSCSSNPGPGGWSAVFEIDGECKVLCGHEVSTTNNRMELQAVIEAYRRIVSQKVRALKSVQSYEIFSDSSYVVSAICKGWIKNWELRGWHNSRGEATKNKDMWEELSSLIAMAEAAKISVNVRKVKGHSGNQLNEMADKIAVMETQKAKEEKRERA